MKPTIKTALLAAVVMLASACAGKQIPNPIIPEPEPVKSSSTEGSLYPGESGKNMFFGDNKALRTGDIVTVHLVENVRAQNRTVNRTSSQTSDTIGITTGSTPTNIGVGGGEDYRGTGDSSRTDALTASVSAMVVEVFANGNMKIEGRRKMKINNEDQFVFVSGIVRQEDISFDNSIISTKIANAEIMYDGVGDLNDSNSGGWATRLMKKVWPF